MSLPRAALFTLAAIATIGCASAQTAPAAPATPPPPACTSPQHRAFDFWIGEWRAYVTGTENLAGLSTIAREDDGCVITEHWRSQRSGFTGRSLNIYAADTGHWEQFWADSSGNITHFIGAPIENGMQLTAEDDHVAGAPVPVFNRMTFTRNADGSVRQFGEQSTDRGQTWSAQYDFTYRRAE
jgi:hypothetical protein